MKVNVNVRIGNKWHSVTTNKKNYQNWFKFAFEKWGFWGLENTTIEKIEGTPTGNWKEIKEWEEITK